MYRGGVLTLALDCVKLLVSYPGKLTSGSIWIRDLVVPRTEQPHLKKKKELSLPGINKILVVLPVASQCID
jgi:hypothetical protein